MTGMSARQFQENVVKGLKAQFGVKIAEQAKQLLGIGGSVHTHHELDTPHGHVHGLDKSITYPMGESSVRRRSTFYMGVPDAPSWECPYCGADHELTVKLCDGCGARRRREYVH